MSAPEQAPAWYRVIEVSKVDPEINLVASRMFEFVRRDLSLPPAVRIAWLVPATADEERADHMRRYHPAAQSHEPTKFRNEQAYLHVGLDSLYTRADQTAELAARQVAHRAKLYQLSHNPKLIRGLRDEEIAAMVAKYVEAAFQQVERGGTLAAAKE